MEIICSECDNFKEFVAEGTYYSRYIYRCHAPGNIEGKDKGDKFMYGTRKALHYRSFPEEINGNNDCSTFVPKQKGIWSWLRDCFKN